MSFDSLPVIIVSAKTEYAATEFISELIDNDVTEEVKSTEELKRCRDSVWRMRTKYYQVDVRVAARGGDTPLASQSARLPAEAHIIYLDEEESVSETAAATAERRLAAAADVHVAAVVCRAVSVPAALDHLCALRRLERVALLEPAASTPAEPFAEERGVRAARALLHAHVWPGLRVLRHTTAAPRPAPSSDTDSSSCGGDEEHEGGEEGVASMERFAAALEVLGDGAQHAARLAAADGRRETRLAAAERLVAEFARALGHELEDLDALPAD